MNRMKSYSWVFFLGGVLTFTSCTLTTHRQYIDLMQEEHHSSLFEPRDDFPVLSGDPNVENYGRRRENAIRRTPASLEGRRFVEQQNIGTDLAQREAKLSEIERDHYLQYRPYLESDSEKIFFLQLESLEKREEYMRARGFMVSTAYAQKLEKQATRNQDIIMGMGKQAVRRSWGRPQKVEVAGDPRFENERWTYYVEDKVRYVYFDRGRVEGWEEAKRTF